MLWGLGGRGGQCYSPGVNPDIQPTNQQVTRGANRSKHHKTSKRLWTKACVEVGQTVPGHMGPHLKQSTARLLIGVRRRRPDCKRQKSHIFLRCHTDIFNTSNQWSRNISHAPLGPNSKPAVTGPGLENSAAAEVRGWPQLGARHVPKYQTIYNHYTPKKWWSLIN